ncbi:MAG: glycosyltransferase [Chitinophagaceae bacterium]
MDPVKVSVIIPIYNTEQYIKDTLVCIISQSFQNTEIILIDDGSTDNSFQIIKSVAVNDKRIKIYRQENRGQSVARNLGISVATGEYFYFMDSDDLLDLDTFSICYDICNERNLDFSFFDAEVFGKTQNNFKVDYLRHHLIKEDIYSGPELLKTLLNSGTYRASPCLNFIRSSYLKKIGLSFYPGIIHEDELFTFFLYINAERVSFINKPFFKRRLRDNSTMSTNFSRKNLNGYFIVSNELIKVKYQLPDKRLRSLVDIRLHEILNGLLYNSRSMQKKDKYYALFHTLFHYPHYLSLKNVVALIFPWVKHLKSGE